MPHETRAWEALLAAVILKAIADATRGDASAADWLRCAGAPWAGAYLGLDARLFARDWQGLRLPHRPHRFVPNAAGERRREG